MLIFNPRGYSGPRGLTEVGHILISRPLTKTEEKENLFSQHALYKYQRFKVIEIDENERQGKIGVGGQHKPHSPQSK